MKRTDWTPKQDQRLQDLWGRLSPHDIGRNMGVGGTKPACEVRARAKFLGLGELAARPALNRPHKKPIQLDDGMIEFAPGHVCDARSYELIKGSRDARQTLDA